MLVGIYELKDPNGRDLAVQQAYEKILAYNGIPSVRLRAERKDFWEQVSGLSLFIMRFQQVNSDLLQARDILPIVESAYGVPCYPNMATAWHYDDKVKQYFLLRANGFPITESWVFYDKKSAFEWAETTTYPVVFKLRGGAGSMNVVLVNSPGRAKQLIKRMFGPGILPEKFRDSGSVRFTHFSLTRELKHTIGNFYRWSKGLDISPYWEVHKNYALFQKFLPNNSCDTRITIIGKRAFAFRRLVRDNDFRASGSGKIDYSPEKIDIRCVELAFEVSLKMDFQSMAYDFLINKEGTPEICEISYTYVSQAIYNCPGYWDPDLKWHPGNYWPEHLHLVDSLRRPDLLVPTLKY